MELKVNVEKKTFRTEKGEQRFYYALTAEIAGESIRLKADERDKKLFMHLLDKMDIPVIAEDDKNALIDKLLSGEILSDSEKAKLRGYLDEEGGR
ncbi:MAG: hypothetical protein HFJ81_00650 [Clostridia bacterium]|nr:hypothetical protein [Clostridia bacterium]